MDLPEFGAEPLHMDILSPLGSGFQRVIFVLMDALSLSRLRRWMAEGKASVWQRLAEGALLAPIPSISPSTTSAALTSLRPAAPQHHQFRPFQFWLSRYEQKAR